MCRGVLDGLLESYPWRGPLTLDLKPFTIQLQGNVDTTLFIFLPQPVFAIKLWMLLCVFLPQEAHCRRPAVWRVSCPSPLLHPCTHSLPSRARTPLLTPLLCLCTARPLLPHPTEPSPPRGRTDPGPCRHCPRWQTSHSFQRCRWRKLRTVGTRVFMDPQGAPPASSPSEGQSLPSGPLSSLVSLTLQAPSASTATASPLTPNSRLFPGMQNW